MRLKGDWVWHLRCCFFLPWSKLKQHVQVFFIHPFHYQTKFFLHPPHDSFDQKIDYSKITVSTPQTKIITPKQVNPLLLHRIRQLKNARSAPHLPPRPGRDFRDGRDALDEEKARGNGEICDGGGEKKGSPFKSCLETFGFFLKHLIP